MAVLLTGLATIFIAYTA